MNTRKFAGYLCLALGFTLILLLGYGVIDPIGASPKQVTSMGALLIGLMPSVFMAAGAFAIGLWLLRGPRQKGPGNK